MSVSTMKKLTVLTPVRDADKLLRRLLRLRCVELQSVPVSELPDGGHLLRLDCEAARQEAERRVSDVSTALAFLDGYAVTARPWIKRPIDITTEVFETTGCRRAAEVVVAEVLRIREERAEALREVNRLEDLRLSLAPWLDYDIPPGGMETAFCEVWLGTFPPPPAPGQGFFGDVSLPDGLHVALAEVRRAEESASRAERKSPRPRYASVLLLCRESDAVARALADVGFERIRWSGLPAPDGTAAENDRLCVKRLGELENQLQAYTDRLRYLSRMLDDIAVLYDLEMTTLVAAQEKQKLVTTGECVLLSGWMPTHEQERVVRALCRLPCAFDLAEPAPEEEPPVLLRNKGVISDFEWVVGMYSYPKYGSFDPTFIMSIFYFIMFGVMFADVGYGAVLLLGGFLLPKIMHTKKSTTRAMHMFAYCGISCIVFGFIFGGWFGDMPYALMTSFFGYESTAAAKEAYPIFNGLVVTLGGSEIVLNPLENPMAFLVISLVIGAVHLLAGMAVKFVILCKRGQVFAAIFDIGSYWVLFAGLGLLAVNTTAAWVVIGVGALMVVATYGRAQKNILMKFLMGLKGLYDLISYASDLLSYCRILALGLAAGVVGQVINLLATMGGPTPGGFVLLVVVMLIGHLLNMAINVLGSFVHTSRLQYLEFFGKFYEDGGVAFAPAVPSEKYSTVETDDQPDTFEMPQVAETSDGSEPLETVPTAQTA